MGKEVHVMKARRTKHNCYCAFCRTPRLMRRRRHIGAVNVIAGALVSACAMLLIWQTFDPRVFVFFAFFAGVSEIVMQVRWRLSIVCKTCGFDPIAYLRDPAAAAEKVKLRLDLRRQDPAAMLGRPLRLPTVTTERAEELRTIAEFKKASAGRLLSKSI